MSIRLLTVRNRDGSEMTQDNRHRGLVAIGDELKTLGYGIKNARNLKPHHVERLVLHWKKTKISDDTIRNRLGWLRWVAQRVGKEGMLPSDNEAYGLEERNPFRGSKAAQLDAAKLARVRDDTIRCALLLQEAFGLRREEALKFRPSIADRGDHIALKAAWCKGGRARIVPITDPRQRDVLDQVASVAGEGSLIPIGKTYIRHLQTYKSQVRAAGLGKDHALRHGYAQRRYETLAGWTCPAAGGRTAEAMTAREREIDHEARLQVSQELGHNRIDVTDRYLGRRWASGHFTRAVS
ncbi:phage integrase N-terminal domain-containing protein [Ensifer soli]|uniref:phage integrase N-terminal domain-containing protein n=1 Tax=Ciceribacter sp. sgz301302 TaxID=3342379 RepID=UPI0035B9E9BF